MKLALATAWLAVSSFHAIAFAQIKGRFDTTTLGLSTGATAPDFSLPDQSGRRRTFASLAGPQGLVLVFFRSADW